MKRASKVVLSWILVFALTLGIVPVVPLETSAWGDMGKIGSQHNVVALGFKTSAAITANGDLYTWGANESGQLGHGDTTNRFFPTKVEGLSNIVSVSMGDYHCAAVTTNGDLYTWGSNSDGQLGHGDTINRSIPTKIEGLSNVVSVSLNPFGHFNAAITISGDLYTWGYFEGLSNIPIKENSLSDVIAVSAGEYGIAAITPDGSLYTFYSELDNYSTVPTKVNGIPNVVAVSMGMIHGGVITENGDVYTWGWNLFGALGHSDTYHFDAYPPAKVEALSDVIAISMGAQHSSAVTSNGDLYTWGTGDIGSEGYNTKPDIVPSLSNVTAISMGALHSSAVTENGDLYIWGGDLYSQGYNGYLGLGHFIHRSRTPELVGSLVNAPYFDGEFVVRDGVLQSYRGLGGEIVIPAHVTEISAGLFYENTSITSVVLNEGLRTIGNHAFANSNVSGPLVFPSTLENIGEWAFWGCSGLTGDLIIPNNVRNVGKYAFFDCSGFDGIIQLSNNMTIINEGTFDNCSGLTGNMIIPENVIEIGDYAFVNCVGLDGTLTLNEGLVSIGDNAFSGCYSLTGNLLIPSSVRTINNAAFAWCYGFDGTIILNDGLESIGSAAFADCFGLSGDLVIPSTVKIIGDHAFQGCNGFNGELTLNSGLESIGKYAFTGCTGLTGDLVIPGTIKTIGDYAFLGCDGFNGELTLKNGLESIGRSAFEDCTGLTGDLIIPGSVKTIDGRAFWGCAGFDGTLTLNFGIEYIGEYSFIGNIGLNGDLIIPDSVIHLGEGAFEGCEGFDGRIQLSSGLSVITHFAFDGCSNISGELIIPDSVMNIGSFAFRGMSQLTSVVFGANVVNIGFPPAPSEFVFGECENITEITFKGLTPPLLINPMELWYMPNLQTIYVPYIAYDDYVSAYAAYIPDGAQIEITDCADYGHILGSGTVTTPATCEDDGILSFYCVSCGELMYQDPISALGHEFNIEIDRSDPNCEDGYIIWQCERCDETETEELPATGEHVWDEGITTPQTEDAQGFITFTCAVCGEIDIQLIPRHIINLTASGDLSGITISWSISSEVDTARYRIYRSLEPDDGFELLTTINNRNTLNFRDTTVATEILYYYYIVGVNSHGHESPPSAIAAGMRGVDEEPPQVTRMTPANNTFINSIRNITVTAIDNVAVNCVILEYSTDAGETWEEYGEKIGSPYTFAFDTTQFEDGIIRIRATAYDAMNNESTPLTYVYYIDNTGPEQVTWREIPYTATSVSITLSWNDVSDDDVSFFRVERKNTDGTYTRVSDVTRTLGLNILNLIPDTEYVYRVVAYDHVSNRGDPSDDLIARTEPDTSPPVITALTPRPTTNATTYYSTSVTVNATAVDDYAVSAIEIQVSYDRENWNTVHTATFTAPQRNRTVSYSLGFSSYSEGPIYVRAVATDFAGNIGDTSAAAPFVQYLIDRTPPAAPTGVQAIGHNGVIVVSWDRGPETDLNRFFVYRSTDPDGVFTRLSQPLSTLNFIDNNDIDETQVYYYQVTANDFAGNESARSETIAAQIIPDTQPPIVVNVFPQALEYIGPGYRTVSIYATDDRALDNIKVEYKGEHTQYSTLQTYSGINSHERTVSVAIPLDNFTHNELISLRITATDRSGNVSEPRETSYIVDKEAPVVFNPQAAYAPGSDRVTVSWESDLSNDLIGYRVFRKNATSNYSLVGSLSAVANRLDYIFNDFSISLGREEYTYRIDTLDNSGNVSSVFTNTVTTDNLRLPVAVISCNTVMEAGVEYEFDASLSTASAEIASYVFDFGDGTTATGNRHVHSYEELGTYIVSLTVTDVDGNVGIASRTITVRERAAIGYAEIRIVDENGSPVRNAPVYFGLGEENQVIRLTNNSGIVTFTADAGRYTVGSIIPDNNWLPVKRDIIIAAGATTNLTMTLVRHTMIEGEFDIRRMSFEEIIAAGIDPSKPENQYIANISVTLTFGVETVTTSFTYNPATGQGTARPFITPSTPGGGGGRVVTPILIDNGPRDGSLSYDQRMSYVTVAILDVPVNATFLKEFFDVNLTIINNASNEFYMKDNIITLDLPDGLSIVETSMSEASRVAFIPEIRGQSRESITWILRGDLPGKYPISADYVGTLALFEEEITTKFVSVEPIRVYGEEGINLILEYEDTVDDGWIWFNVGFQNNREASPYAYVDLLSIDVPGAEPYIVKRSNTENDYREYGNPDDRWSLDNWREREEIPDFDGHMVVNPGEIIWKYYKVPIDVFATYINEDLPWNSESEAIGSTLVGVIIQVMDDSGISLPVRVVPLGTKRTHLYGDGPIKINFPSSDGSTGDMASWSVAYTDGFFRNRNTLYNHSLATYSLGLALSGFSSRNLSPVNESDLPLIPHHNHNGITAKPKFIDSDTLDTCNDGCIELCISNCVDECIDNCIEICLDKLYEICPVREVARRRTRNLLHSYTEMEFGCVEFHNYGRAIHDDVIDEVAYSFAHKTIIVEGQAVALVSVVVRGGEYGTEWGSNFRVRNPSAPEARLTDHFGFRKSADQVIARLNKYSDSHNLANAKFWITSYSRGSAVSNLVAKQLIDDGKDVYAYLFASPQPTTDPAASGGAYSNIFNIVNPTDFVTDVPFSAKGPYLYYLPGIYDWGFGRYGTDLIMPSLLTHSDYIFKHFQATSHLTRFPGANNPFQEIGLNYLRDNLILRAFPRIDNYDYLQETFVALVADLLGEGSNVSYDDAIRLLLSEAGVKDIYALEFRFILIIVDIVLDVLSGNIAEPLLAYLYATSGLMLNHMPEYYIAWMQSFTASELFSENNAFKAAVFAFQTLRSWPFDSSTLNSDPAPALPVNADIIVRSKNGDIVYKVINGEIIEQLIAAIYEDGRITVYLPGDEDYEIEIIPRDDALMNYSLIEYNNKELMRIVTQENITALKNQIISAAIVAEQGIHASNYNLSMDGIAMTDITVNDLMPEEIDYTFIHCSTAGDGMAFGDGMYITGQSVIMTALSLEDSIFLGWYEDDILITTSEKYLFIAANDRNLVAKFSNDSDPETFTVTAINATGGGEYAEGDEVTLTADTAIAGQRFREWLITPEITFLDGTNLTTETVKFLMPAESVSATAVFEDETANISIAITPPAAGQTPDAFPTLSQPGSYTISTASWSPRDNPFQSGKIYTVTIRLSATGEYLFPAVGNLSITINGQDARIISRSASGKDVTISYTFPALPDSVETKEIANAAISIAAPAPGQAPASTASTAETGYTISAASWSPRDNPFQAGKAYTVTLRLTATGDNTFAAANSLSITINGQAARIISRSASGKDVTISYTFPTLPDTTGGQITNAALTVTAPIGGQAPSATVATENTGYTHTTASWSPRDNPFQTGKTYTVTIRLTADTGYEFAAGQRFEATINGIKATVTSNTGRVVMLTATFTAG